MSEKAITITVLSEEGDVTGLHQWAIDIVENLLDDPDLDLSGDVDLWDGDEDFDLNLFKADGFKLNVHPVLDGSTVTSEIVYSARIQFRGEDIQRFPITNGDPGDEN